MEICPKKNTIRRKKINDGDIETDRFPIDPTNESIASIKNIVINFDEAVSILFLAFHVKDNVFCEKIKVEETEKRFCELKNVNYVHFHFSLGGYSPNDSEYLIAFLPKFIGISGLSTLINEFYNVAEWLGLKNINCIVFRYGAPVHGMQNNIHWQRKMNEFLEEIKKVYLLHKAEGRIKDIPTSLKEKNLTISKNRPLESINVS